ncbi:CDP-diacylglycerol--serine O-phosphatidyltransferase [Simiduia agarivorans]|uniref:CDP-diacylglycerol--serine O-phosphatidyltransferase n=1 Tax=Simiduia agarivorans (strain DSM 21679 / JCM 13881 / BCRC 17597 / SA1) TaxID=1117647 RepID=K4KKZ8_SIMAS|nr:CDP-diacylglycerol--serine O-phosphatidyltransferase [Simiduia agarivorans]AFU98910.1 phosphatidylserine synthase [Simiduia agarivorans SA1 = DSM 21679]
MSETKKSASPVENEQAVQGETIDPLHSALIDEHVEEVEENGRKVRHRGIYLLPNLFTTGALFSGFYAIIAGMNGNFEAAAIAIFVAMVLDGLDGRVARLTNTSSAFGEQYDSLSDMVSFGVAPALVMFSWALQDLGKFGWAAAFTYCAGAALRLARFNTQIGVVDKRFFIGLASPSAAALVAGTVWAGHDVDPSGLLAWVAALVATFAGIMMVSNVRYTSFKDVDFKGRVPFVVMLVVVLAFAIITIDPPRILLAIFAGYACSGPFMATWRYLKRRKSVVTE